MKGNGVVVNRMAQANRFSRQVASILVSLLMVIVRAKASMKEQMEVFTKGNGSRTRGKALENTRLQAVIAMKDSGNLIRRMDMEK